MLSGLEGELKSSVDLDKFDQQLSKATGQCRQFSLSPLRPQKQIVGLV